MRILFACVLLVVCGSLFAADSMYVRHITDTLCSKEFSGRGYINNGMAKSANFMATEMRSIGLTPFNKQSFFQEFAYPVNTFPGAADLEINGGALVPGRDFIVKPYSKSASSKGKLQQIDSLNWVYKKGNIEIHAVNKLTWGVSTKQSDYTRFEVLQSKLGQPETFKCKVNAKMLQDFTAQNIGGFIKGSKNPDSLIVFTAHYDHLGVMGNKAWFPGANDNAGGVAMMLDLAKHYMQQPPPYSILFIAFAGEEAGLIGSKYFVENPLVDLKKIRFLLNLDLMANGEEGVTVVNATEFPNEFTLLQQINEQNHLLTAVNGRGKAANSDHYWFTEKGVPSFFIYTLGSRKCYHDIDDIPSTLPWSEINDIERLLTLFVKQITD